MANALPGLADSHVHLHAYDDAAVESMLRRAGAAGVERVVAVSVDEPSSRRTLELARLHPGTVVAAVGLHPGRMTGPVGPTVWRSIEQMAELPEVGALGECGVDGVDGRASADVQLEVLGWHADLAGRVGKPLLLHFEGDTLIGRALDALPRDIDGVVHYFVGDRALAERYLGRGLYISLGRPVTRVGNAGLREAARTIPLARLLLETDTYPLAGRGTEPADVRLVAEAVAGLRGISAADVAMATGENLRRFLGGVGSDDRHPPGNPRIAGTSPSG